MISEAGEIALTWLGGVAFALAVLAIGGKVRAWLDRLDEDFDRD